MAGAEGTGGDFVVGIGGTTLPGSSTERAVAHTLSVIEAAGIPTVMFDGAALARLPLYVPGASDRTPEEQAFVAAIRRATGVVIASPGYHGSISGLVKNALDLVEETSGDARPYFAGMPVGLMATAYGWQATGSTIAALRSIAHALRGWPTPFAAAINSQATRFDADGGCNDPAVLRQLGIIADQMIGFLRPSPRR
ncbi:NADPH-dependent FMN reductase [Sphingomonas sp. KR1UV-12]|uniref:NADPH-dependent FMN reductase n=1 Tax=Sphingomonas aurea TaxID=3063994 RepID=A0ABT9ENV9_9SPHN|nr:NADPH-dependent FMN reductase [Sphingomonas sp. KR1UV-12]MDP1028649.1 NADPH-dependent FMN reductase [Sphingomonas sp. KR1UV-12]